ncbi:hypothetical protein [Dyadobacter frigoris]|nr:hypothetical protein [Dyadobacter frigoris]
MSDINKIIARLEFAQNGWVVPDIYATIKLLRSTLGTTPEGWMRKLLKNF